MKSISQKIFFTIIIITMVFLTAGCFPIIKLLPGATAPLKEVVLKGEGRDKVVIININGIISDKAQKDVLSREEPSLLQEVVSQLDMAKKDPRVKAVVLKINSPGGTITASDIIYQKILRFKKETGDAIVASMMDVAASGGYYVALPTDQIIATPTTITGSVGVIFLTPKVYDLMDKIGVGMNVRTSGKNKDMGSPFRKNTPEEDAIFNSLIHYYGDRFLTLVEQNRSGKKNLAIDEIKTARIFDAHDALAAGLIDRIGYLEDAIAAAEEIAGLPADSRVVMYRRTAYPNDTIYNTLSAQAGVKAPSLINVDFLNALSSFSSGFYYMWWPGAEE